jgi:hypothetical protein
VQKTLPDSDLVLLGEDLFGLPLVSEFAPAQTYFHGVLKEDGSGCCSE